MIGDKQSVRWLLWCQSGLVWSRGLACVLLLGFTVSGCATSSAGSGRIWDPLEPANRAMLDVNQTLSGMFLTPVATMYRELTPDVVRQSIRNVFALARKPVDLVNSLLQGDWQNAGDVAAATVINATVGLAGLIDVAAEFDIRPRNEDFGQTLAVWGVGTGPYLVLPLLGPTNLRDFAGLGIDYTIDPLTWTLSGHHVFQDGRGLTGVAGENASSYMTGVDVVSGYEQQLGILEEIEDTSLDFYAALRSLVTQNRASKIANSGNETEDSKSH